jgi:hypothetical protein
MLPGGGSVPSGHGSTPFDLQGAPRRCPPAAPRARRATQFGAPPQKKILVAGGLTRQPAQDRWHSFVGDLKPGWDGSDYAEPGIAFAGPAERIDRLAEAIAVLKAAFSGERFSFMAWETSLDPFAEGGPGTELTGGMFRASWIFAGGPGPWLLYGLGCALLS